MRAGGGRRAAVAEVGAGHDGPRRDGHADAAGAGQGHQDHAQGAHHAEGRAQGVGDEAGQQERHQQEQLRRDDAQPVIDEEGDGPGAAPQGGDGADEHVDHDHAAHFAALPPRRRPSMARTVIPRRRPRAAKAAMPTHIAQDQRTGPKGCRRPTAARNSSKTEDSAHRYLPGMVSVMLAAQVVQVAVGGGGKAQPSRRIWRRSGPPRRGAPAMVYSWLPQAQVMPPRAAISFSSDSTSYMMTLSVKASSGAAFSLATRRARLLHGAFAPGLSSPM